MKKQILITLFICSYVSIYAQKNDDFEQFKKQAQADSLLFRRNSVAVKSC
jgi:hypothetical protein